MGYWIRWGRCYEHAKRLADRRLLRGRYVADAMMKPLAIELFAGLHGWGEGLVDAGFRVVGFDITDMCKFVGVPKPDGCELVLQDVTTIDGARFKDASVIVASPPCQEFSYMAMPWSKAKAKQAKIEADPAERKRLTALFDACFRIQREASAAAGHHIPMIVENVMGAQKWVGRAKWHFGSYYLWGDVPALMPTPGSRRMKFPAPCNQRMWKDREPPILSDGTVSPAAHAMHMRLNGTKGIPHAPTGHGTNPAENGVKQGGDWFRDPDSMSRKHGSKSNARKIASALIAKIPFPLANHIAKCYAGF